MKLRHTIASITLLAMLTPMGNAFAQTSNSNATSGANSSSNSGAVSGSSSNATTGPSNSNSSARGGNAAARASNALTINNPGVTSSTIGGGLNNTDRVSTTSQNSNANQSYGSQGVYGSQTLYSAPTVYVPSVVGGNPCTNGASIGGSVVGFGIAGGLSWTDEECNKRQWTALMYQAGERDLAREVACDKREVYDAAKRVGRPCYFRENFEAKGAVNPNYAQPVVITPVGSTPVVMAPAPALAPMATPAMVEQCMDRRGRVVSPGTPGASCGMVAI